MTGISPPSLGTASFCNLRLVFGWIVGNPDIGDSS
jgi:hypothetical protein